jgi:hypothetical protein
MPCRADSLLLGVLGAVALRDPRWLARIENNYRVLVFALVVFASGMVIFTKMKTRSTLRRSNRCCDAMGRIHVDRHVLLVLYPICGGAQQKLASSLHAFSLVDVDGLDRLWSIHVPPGGPGSHIWNYLGE